MAFINIPGKDNSTTLSPDEFNYFVNKVNSLKLAVLQGSGFVGALRISDVPNIDGWYFATESGTYTNAGNINVQLDGNLSVIVVSNFGGTFTLIETPIPQGEALDKQITRYSVKGIENNGIWNALYGAGGLSSYIDGVSEQTDTNTKNITGLVGGLINQGGWDASSNTPNIDSYATSNEYWIVTNSGNTNLGNTNTWNEGDWAIKTQNGWLRINVNTYLDGAVIAPASAVDGNIALFDGVTGKLIKDSGVSLSSTTDANYEHDQSSPQTVWQISHGLNKKASAVVVDSADSVIVGDILYLDNNNLTITFNSSFSGYAYLN